MRILKYYQQSYLQCLSVPTLLKLISLGASGGAGAGGVGAAGSTAAASGAAQEQQQLWNYSCSSCSSSSCSVVAPQVQALRLHIEDTFFVKKGFPSPFFTILSISSTKFWTIFLFSCINFAPALIFGSLALYWILL